jgi:hypothetical protein
VSVRTAFTYTSEPFVQSNHASSYDTSRAVAMLSDPSMRAESHVGRNASSRFDDILDYMKEATCPV